MKSVKGRKEGKDEELRGKKSEVPERTKCCVCESKQKEKRKIERVREDIQ